MCMRRKNKNKAASGLAACDIQIKNVINSNHGFIHEIVSADALWFDGAKIGKNFETGTD